MDERYSAAAAARRGEVQPAHRPRQRRALEDEAWSRGLVLGGAPSLVRARVGVETRDDLLDNGQTPVVGAPHVVGIASRTEAPYEMWDFFGPYTEVVDARAFDETLAADPLVEFTLNHNRGGGAPMAHTRNGTLKIGLDDEDNLTYDADVDETRNDVSDMLKALQRGDLAESSFKFAITRGIWSPDYTEYRILGVDLNRGDVSSVNFGANPDTTSGVRATVKPVVVRRRIFVDEDVVDLSPGLRI